MNEQTKNNQSNDGLQSMLVCWLPAWHELDQSLAVGETPLIALEEISPPRQFNDQQIHWKFSSGLDPDGGFEKNATVEAIQHPVLGEIIKVDACGLDYIVYPADGEEIIVDAEEDPGMVHNRDVQIEDWSMVVQLTIIEPEVA